MTLNLESPKTISLSEFAARAVEGEPLEQELTSGETVAARVFTPDQSAVVAVQRIWNRILKTASAASTLSDISDTDLTLAMDLGFACLRACVRDESGAAIPDEAFVDLFAKLPFNSPLMVRCQELCGAPATLFQIPPFNPNLAIKALRDGDGGDDAAKG